MFAFKAAMGLAETGLLGKRLWNWTWQPPNQDKLELELTTYQLEVGLLFTQLSGFVDDEYRKFIKGYRRAL